MTEIRDEWKFCFKMILQQITPLRNPFDDDSTADQLESPTSSHKNENADDERTGSCTPAMPNKRISDGAAQAQDQTQCSEPPKSKRQKSDFSENHLELLQLEKEKNVIQIENAKLQREVLLLQYYRCKKKNLLQNYK